jgi:DNA replication protein DnaC
LVRAKGSIRTVGSEISEIVDRITAYEPSAEERAAADRRDRIARGARLAEQEAKLLAKVGRRYANASLDAFKIVHTDMPPVIDALRAYEQELFDRADAGEGIVLFGPAGAGKDFLLVAILRAAVHAGLSIGWTDGADLFGRMRDRITDDSGESELIASLTRPAVLGISDLVPENATLTDYQRQTVFRIVDRRYRDLRPTLVTVNTQGGSDFASRCGQALYDRLRDGSLCLACNWPSYRKPRSP